MSADQRELAENRRTGGSKGAHPMIAMAESRQAAAFVVGGDLLFREGLKRLFESVSIRTLGEAESIYDIAHASERIPAPEVVVVIDLPSTARQRAWGEMIRESWPETRLVLLASPRDDSAVVSAVRNGADGCLFKDMSPAALAQSISLVTLGENVFPTRMLRDVLLHGAAGTQGEGGVPKLTPREKDILRGLLAGHSNKMIANNLGTTDMTVKAQLRHLLRKIGAQNRTQAALWAREHGAICDLETSGYPAEE